MYNVFKEPIICNLGPSSGLVKGFLVICLIPMLSVLVFFSRSPAMVFVLCVLLVTFSVFYIGKYATRSWKKSIVGLRLHKDSALITYRNQDARSSRITGICMAGSWIVIQFAGNSEKVLVDMASVGSETYSRLRRQIKSYRKADCD